MADEETTELFDAHAPKPASLELYSEIETDLKKALLHSRHDSAKHGVPYWETAAHLSDADFVNFSVSDLELVRPGKVAYGNFLLCKLKIPALAEVKNSYIHFRAFEKQPGTAEKAKLHSLHTDSKREPDGGMTYNALYSKDDELEFFHT